MKEGFILNYLEMFNKLESVQPSDSSDVDTKSYQPTYYDQPPVPNWQDDFSGIITKPVLYNMDGYISPYASNNWGGTSMIMKNLEDETHNPPLSNKVDPNKIFNSDISALRALAADQKKISKLFEKRLVESLTDRGKVGLNEEDIMAMQALTAANNAIASINKEQINIKKNIADLRIKQSQNRTSGSAGDPSLGSRGMSSVDVGRSILDSIFDVPSSNITNMSTPNVNYQTSSESDASMLIDSIIPSSESNPYIKYESSNPTTYVTVGDSDSDAEFMTYDSSGELISDYPNPTTKIVKIDREANIAVDECLVQYPLRNK